ncbi:hypothetical protein CQW44_14370 [Streptomyces griseofuscus]|uniref:PDZ domain-containing protein n=2 Tax=Streptomyces griseofuscus TaxID=146922 RepID=A0A426S7T8_9ACTN|nr:hypothetical protein CQW44_14370 [Streptomyces griseofuscus]
MAADRAPSPSGTGPGGPRSARRAEHGMRASAGRGVHCGTSGGRRAASGDVSGAFFVPGHAADPEPPAVTTPGAAHPVRTGSPAQAGGLRAGDRISAVDGNLVPDARVAVAALRSRRPGSTVVLTVGRGNGCLHLSVRPATGLPRSAPR